MKKKTASSIICENFKVPHQTIFQDYKCSYKSSLTYFGRLYVGQEHVCFIANMFGILKKCVIEIQRIQKLQQPSKNCLFISEKQGGSSTVQYNFSGFKTDHAYTLIKALWKKQKIQSEVLNANDDEQSLVHPNQQGEINKQKFIDEGNVQSSFFNTKAIQTDRQKLLQLQLPCSVQQYYSFFLADNATVYPRKKHLQLKDSKQIVVTPWKKSQELDSQVRQITALIRVNGVPFMNYAHLSQVWKMKRKQNNEIQFQVVTQMSDVPYSNYFVVNNYYNIIKDGETKCKMIVQMSVVFNKSTYMKNTILTRTFPDNQEDFNFWVNQVKTILQKMKKTQEAEINFRSSKNLRLSKKQSSDIQFQTEQSNKVSKNSETKGNLLNETRNQRKYSETNESQIGNLSKKIDSLTKLVKVLLVLIFFLIIINCVSLWSHLSQSSSSRFSPITSSQASNKINTEQVKDNTPQQI